MDTKKLRQKILDLAIRGKLVPQDPNDEPASVLLERIRAEKEQLIKEGKIKRSKKSAATDKSHYENVPFEIPENWCWVTGNDIFNAMISCKPQGDEFKYIDIDSIDNKNHRIISPKILKVKNAPSRASRYTQPGDVLFSMVRPYLKNIALVEEDSCIASTGFFVCSPMQLLTSEYCYYMMLSDYVIYGLNQYMKGDNSPSINNGHITSWLYPIPPINEQLRISAEIKKWFVFIDDLERGKIELESLVKQVKSKILDLAISGKLVPQDPNDEPAIELLKRINPSFEPCDNSHYENLPFEEPDGWCWATLGSIGKWQSGATPSRMRKDYYGGDIPWLKTGDLNDWYITDIPEYITQQALNETSVKLNPAGSILIAMYGATIGKIGILTMPATTNQACCACISHNGIEQMYLFYYLLSHKEEFVRQGGGGAQPNISKEKIVETLIPIPPLSEQLRIIKAIEAIFNQIDTITAELS